MAVNYMDRLAALRGDRQHAAGASSHSRSAPVLHADEKSKSKRKGKRKLSRKQLKALASGRKKQAQMRAEKKMGKKKRKSPKRSSKRRSPGKAERRTSRLAKFRTRAAKRGKTVRKRKSKGVTTYTFAKKRRRKKSASKRKYKRKKTMAKSSKRSRAAKKAARTRARNKAARREAGRKAARKRKRKHGGGRKRSGHGRKRSYSRSRKRSAPKRRRRRGGRARRRNKGLIRRHNRSGKFVGRGGRIRGRKRRGGYHKAGRVVRESYSMENPLDMSEVAVGLGMGLVGFIAADVADRMMAGRGKLGGTLYAEAAPIYSDYYRLGVAFLLTAAPLAGAHFVNGAKHKHLRTGLQFIGFGAGIRSLGHLVTDVIASQFKSNSMIGPTVQALYPHEIVSGAQSQGVAQTGAAGLPEHIGEAARGLGAIPEGLAACCNTSSRMLNTALSPLQPIGRSAEMGGAAAGYGPPPVALPPPIERIVQQPYSPPSVTRQATPVPLRDTAPVPPPAITQQPQLAPREVVAQTPSAQSMAAAYAPVSAMPVAQAGVNGLPPGPFSWSADEAND